MFQHQGIWLPDGERHFPEWMDRNGEMVGGKGTYQIKKLRAAMEHVRAWRCAVDVGAHVGLWSMRLVERFKTVHAFEPVEAFRQCWNENMPANFVGVGGNIAILYPLALGAARGKVAMRIPTLSGGIDSGGTHVATDHGKIVGGGDIDMRPLDEFDLPDVDFLKIDCEGFELEVLRGAADTLARCQPCVIVEQKPHKLGPNFGIKGTPAVDFLRAAGAELKKEIGGDFIMAWPA